MMNEASEGSDSDSDPDHSNSESAETCSSTTSLHSDDEEGPRDTHPESPYHGSDEACSYVIPVALRAAPRSAESIDALGRAACTVALPSESSSEDDEEKVSNMLKVFRNIIFHKAVRDAKLLWCIFLPRSASTTTTTGYVERPTIRAFSPGRCIVRICWEWRACPSALRDEQYDYEPSRDHFPHQRGHFLVDGAGTHEHGV